MGQLHQNPLGRREDGSSSVFMALRVNGHCFEDGKLHCDSRLIGMVDMIIVEVEVGFKKKKKKRRIHVYVALHNS